MFRAVQTKKYIRTVIMILDWAVHVALLGNIENAYKNFIVKA